MESALVGIPALTALRLLGWFFYLLPEPLRKLWVAALAFVLSSLGVRRRVIELDRGSIIRDQDRGVYGMGA